MHNHSSLSQQAVEDEKIENSAPRLTDAHGIAVLIVVIVCSCMFGALASTLYSRMTVVGSSIVSVWGGKASKANNQMISPPPSAPASFEHVAAPSSKDQWVELHMQHPSPPIPANDSAV